VTAYSTGAKNTSASADNAPPAGVSPEPPIASVTPDPRSRPNYRPDVDGLRALAIIPVIVFHAFPTIMPGGFVGVDVFFVISGFLISGIILQGLQRGDFTFAGFYGNRIRRLFPALLVVLAACFTFGWFFLLPDEYAQLGKHIVGAATYVENILLCREAGYFDIGLYLKPLMHLWSLSVEEQFYLTYPLFLWSVWRFRRNLFAILASIALISFCLNIWQVHRDPVSAFFLPQTRAWELAVGGAIACWQLLIQERHPLAAIPSGSSSLHSAALSNISSAIGLLLITFAVLRIHENDAFPGWWALLPVSGAALLVLSGPGLSMPGAWINRRILSNRLMVFVGLISYPLYLWHWPILTLPRMVRGSELSVTFRATAVLLSFVLAWGTWRFVESPIRFGSKSGRKIWTTPVALAAMSALIGSLGYASYRDGFIGRFPMAAGDLGRQRDVQWSTPDCRKRAGLAEIDYCRSATDRPPDVLVVGDSHAAVLYAGLAPAYLQRSQSLMNLGEAGCVPLYDTESFSPGVHHKNCQPGVNRMLDYVTSAASAHTIILSLRGPRYMSGQGFGPIAAGAPPKEILWAGAPKNTAQPEMFAGALRSTVSRLYATGKTLILVIDWPELGFDPRSCLPRQVRLFSATRSSCAVPRAQVDARNLSYRKLILELQKEFVGLKVFDPLPYLCDSSACYGMSAGHLLYSDDNHLSDTGATYLAAKFLAEQSPRPN
jgi:peptidoglycan/LPS O-acetylase OafA/YrhL